MQNAFSFKCSALYVRWRW